MDLEVCTAKEEGIHNEKNDVVSPCKRCKIFHFKFLVFQLLQNLCRQQRGQYHSGIDAPRCSPHISKTVGLKLASAGAA